MFVLLILLAAGTFAYLWWLRTRTTLTRACRWREDRTAGLWRCAYCGAETVSEGAPLVCLRGIQR